MFLLMGSPNCQRNSDTEVSLCRVSLHMAISFVFNLIRKKGLMLLFIQMSCTCCTRFDTHALSLQKFFIVCVRWFLLGLVTGVVENGATRGGV